MFARHFSALALLSCILKTVDARATGSGLELDITVTSGTFRGVANTNGTDSWFGIPFAQPPRCKESKMPRNSGCMPSASGLQPRRKHERKLLLVLNVWRPTGTVVDARLPVMVWFYVLSLTGVWICSAASNPLYDPTRIVNLSVTMGKPIIFVSVNYRLNTFGFLASADVPPGDLNAGLWDQRAALVFIQENIVQFGGDPSKVTIWGQSAGAGSVEAQMLYATEPNLFRAVIADSSTGPFKNAPYAWQYDKPGMPYSRLLAATGCTAGPDSVECLRQVPYETLLNVTNTMTDSSLNGQLWQPAIGPVGSFAPVRPSQKILSGDYLHVPYLGGTNLNEGTTFSETLYNLSLPSSEQTAAFNSWMSKLLVDNSTLKSNIVAGIDNVFPVNDTTYGGAWHTGDMLFDRAESWYTDNMFLAPRRFLYEHGAELQPMWGYYFTEFIPGNDPILGVYHASELSLIFGPIPNSVEDDFANQMTGYWIRFVNDMSPGPDWPRYGSSSKYVMQLMRDNITLVPDDFSIARTQYLNSPAVLAAFEK
ncbi:alpha beta-hydrolase [Melanogaster broomeanus]|nr:alpha beta-hydrolase [Melanogaster broomeanus]